MHRAHGGTGSPSAAKAAEDSREPGKSLGGEIKGKCKLGWAEELCARLGGWESGLAPGYIRSSSVLSVSSTSVQSMSEITPPFWRKHRGGLT